MKGKPDPAVEPIARITVLGEPLAVRNGLKALFSSLTANRQPTAHLENAEIVLAEAMNNIVEHAYADRIGQIEVAIYQVGTDLQCHLVDQGTPMPDGSLPQGKLPCLENVVGVPEGGFGWFLIRTLASDLTYKRIEGRNHLTFCISSDQSI